MTEPVDELLILAQCLSPEGMEDLLVHAREVARREQVAPLGIGPLDGPAWSAWLASNARRVSAELAEESERLRGLGAGATAAPPEDQVEDWPTDMRPSQAA